MNPNVFTAALYAIGRTWRQSRCPSTDEWRKQMGCAYTMEYYLAIKRNEFKSVVARWMNLEPVTQSEVNQKQKNKYRILTHIYTESRKTVLMKLFAGKEWRHIHRE